MTIDSHQARQNSLSLDTRARMEGMKRGINAFFGGLLWAVAWVAFFIGLCAVVDALPFGASRIPPSVARGTGMTAIVMTFWFWQIGFWRTWSRHQFTHDPKWYYCCDYRPCGCSLPKACIKSECSCEKIHVCADPQCKCGRPKVCTSEKCSCNLPKAFSFKGKSTWTA